MRLLTGATVNEAGKRNLGTNDVSRSLAGHRLGPSQCRHRYDTSMLDKIVCDTISEAVAAVLLDKSLSLSPAVANRQMKSYEKPEDAFWVFLTGRIPVPGCTYELICTVLTVQI